MDKSKSRQKASSENPPRRGFFRTLTALLAAAATVVLAMPLVRYFISVRSRRVHWVSMGRVGELIPWLGLASLVHELNRPRYRF